MSSEGEGPSGPTTPSAAVCAEAAAWIAHLHGEDRTAKVEAGFKRWLAADPAHRIAFEMANDIWTATERCPQAAAHRFVTWSSRPRFFTAAHACFVLSAVVAVLATATSVYLHLREPSLETAVGEQRTFTFEDGTRVVMNTATRIHVRYDRISRRIKLDRGEALFEVAKRPNWPFVVTVGAQQVRALGTAFLVRRSDQQVAVTLVEGTVTVSGQRQRDDLSSAALRKLDGVPPGLTTISSERKRGFTRAQGEEFTLSPGQRLTLGGNELPRLDRPVLDRITAWERGQVIFDHTSLADAASEMNRYSGIELRIASPDAARAQVTGIFRTGDSENFAQAVAEAYRLKVIVRPGIILLVGAPRSRNP